LPDRVGCGRGVTMKSYAQIAASMYAAYRKDLQNADSQGHIWGQPVPEWNELEQDRQNAWIEAAKQAAAELALAY
jgi:transcriptional regulator of met regulon